MKKACSMEKFYLIVCIVAIDAIMSLSKFVVALEPKEENYICNYFNYTCRL